MRQGLSWLLNALAPPPPQRPKPRPRPTTAKAEQFELLKNEPTNITPVFDNTLSPTTANPDKQAAINSINSLSDKEFQNLLAQLEAAQKDPSKINNLDLSFLKAMQNKPKTSNVEIINSGTSGSSSKIVSATRGTTKHQSVTQTDATVIMNRDMNRDNLKSTTAVPLPSNSIAAEETTTASTPRARLNLPPVKLNPIPGVPQEETQVRGQLVSAAVNVTKALSQFLGSAIQVIINLYKNVNIAVKLVSHFM